jgi:peptidoglycan/xylan/chitin deacetylase (PgdA/CDA1 family)
LTFDDDHGRARTPKVLAALAHECVRATFFLIGKAGLRTPRTGARLAAQGHTVGSSHLDPSQSEIHEAGRGDREIDKGIAAVEMALHGKATTTPSTPFFRYPFFEMTPATLENLQQRGIAVFGATSGPVTGCR